MKLYIDGPEDRGEGVYYLIAETGECLASHFCSNDSFAHGDLVGRFPERQAEWRARFGEYEVAWTTTNAESRDALMARNKALNAATLAPRTGGDDGDA